MKEQIELKREIFTILYDVHLGKIFTDQAVNKIIGLILSKIDEVKTVYVEDWTSKDLIKPIIEAINKKEIKNKLRN
jgi:hypothetical protein